MGKMDIDIVERERLVDQEHLPEEWGIVSGTLIARMSQSAPWSTLPKAANTCTDLVTDSVLSSVLLQSLEQQQISNATKTFLFSLLFLKTLFV